MKKIIALLLVLVMVVSLTACKSKNSFLKSWEKSLTKFVEAANDEDEEAMEEALEEIETLLEDYEDELEEYGEDEEFIEKFAEINEEVMAELDNQYAALALLGVLSELESAGF